MLEIGASGSVGGEGGNILAYPARSPIAVIIDRCAGDRQLFWVYGKEPQRHSYCNAASTALAVVLLCTCESASRIVEMDSLMTLCRRCAIRKPVVRKKPRRPRSESVEIPQ
jgi:hypothetical protein